MVVGQTAMLVIRGNSVDLHLIADKLLDFSLTAQNKLLSVFITVIYLPLLHKMRRTHDQRSPSMIAPFIEQSWLLTSKTE
jgi:hypothetical protein